jgi:hypothetical protein
MGLGDVARAADQWKWVAIEIREQTLSPVNEAVRNVNGRILPSVVLALSTFSQCLKILTLVVTLVLLGLLALYYRRNEHSRSGSLEEANRHYLYMHYGRDVEEVAKTCICLVKQIAAGIRDELGSGARVLLVGNNDGVAARIWEHRTTDKRLNESLVSGIFSFKTIKDAMKTIEEYDTSDFAVEIVSSFFSFPSEIRPCSGHSTTSLLLCRALSPIGS